MDKVHVDNWVALIVMLVLGFFGYLAGGLRGLAVGIIIGVVIVELLGRNPK